MGPLLPVAVPFSDLRGHSNFFHCSATLCVQGCSVGCSCICGKCVCNRGTVECLCTNTLGGGGGVDEGKKRKHGTARPCSVIGCPCGCTNCEAANHTQYRCPVSECHKVCGNKSKCRTHIAAHWPLVEDLVALCPVCQTPIKGKNKHALKQSVERCRDSHDESPGYACRTCYCPFFKQGTKNTHQRDDARTHTEPSACPVIHCPVKHKIADQDKCFHEHKDGNILQSLAARTACIEKKRKIGV